MLHNVFIDEAFDKVASTPTCNVRTFLLQSSYHYMHVSGDCMGLYRQTDYITHQPTHNDYVITVQNVKGETRYKM